MWGWVFRRSTAQYGPPSSIAFPNHAGTFWAGTLLLDFDTMARYGLNMLSAEA
jgi:hypothetical protein